MPRIARQCTRGVETTALLYLAALAFDGKKLAAFSTAVGRLNSSFFPVSRRFENTRARSWRFCSGFERSNSSVAREPAQPPSRSTEKSWLHFRPPAVD